MLALALSVASVTLAAQAAVALPTHSPQSVYSLPDAAFEAQARADLGELRRLAASLRALTPRLEAQGALYRQSPDTPYPPEAKRQLLGAWAELHDYAHATEALRQRYWDFLRVSERRHPAKHAWGYVLTHTALTTLLAHGLAHADRVGAHAQLEVLLDEAQPEAGVPPRAWAAFKARVVHVATTTQLLTGDEYGQRMRPLLHRLRLLDVPDVVWATQEMRHASRSARGALRRRGARLYALAAADLTRDAAARAVFPVQAGVAGWMGDTRVRRQGRPLITPALVEQLLPRLQPGDVLVARQNWYLSNVGLPGFWPHAELYLGTREELAAHFDDDAGVRAWLAAERAKDPGVPERFSAHLARAFPQKWAAYGAGDGHGGPVRILESISEGVSFTGVAHGMLVDYLAALRPRLPKVERARAIARAFALQGRPYDFDFDFFSDASLVCTELVWKAYQPGDGMRGLAVPLVEVAGRRTLPANQLVALYAREAGREDRQLDFVAFLDGSESKGTAAFADEAAFRQSHLRLKWDVAQR